VLPRDVLPFPVQCGGGIGGASHGVLVQRIGIADSIHYKIFPCLPSFFDVEVTCWAPALLTKASHRYACIHPYLLSWQIRGFSPCTSGYWLPTKSLRVALLYAHRKSGQLLPLCSCFPYFRRCVSKVPYQAQVLLNQRERCYEMTNRQRLLRVLRLPCSNVIRTNRFLWHHRSRSGPHNRTRHRGQSSREASTKSYCSARPVRITHVVGIFH
jgi:hypothetical protein